MDAPPALPSSNSTAPSASTVRVWCGCSVAENEYLPLTRARTHTASTAVISTLTEALGLFSDAGVVAAAGGATAVLAIPATRKPASKADVTGAAAVCEVGSPSGLDICDASGGVVAPVCAAEFGCDIAGCETGGSTVFCVPDITTWFTTGWCGRSHHQ